VAAKVFLWDRVISAGVKGITAQYAPNSHKGTFEGAMLVNRLIAVMGTGWIKPAGVGRQARGQYHLIQTNQRQDKDARPIYQAAGHIPQARFVGIIM